MHPVCPQPMPALCGEPGAELDPSPLRLCACALQAAASGLPRETAAPARVVAPCSSPVVATCPRSLGPSPPLPDLAGVGVLSDCPLQPASGKPRAAIPGPGSLLRSSPLPRWKKLAPAAAPSRAERAPRLHGALGSPGTGCLRRRLLLGPSGLGSPPPGDFRPSPRPRGRAPATPLPRSVRSLI